MSRHSGDWAEIEGGRTPSRGEFRVFETPCHTAEGPVLLATDTHGNRHILLPLRSGVGFENDERSSGVQLRSRELIDGAEHAAFVDVICTKPHLFSVFEYFGDELLDAVAADPGRPAMMARRTLNRWRELFDRAVPGVLGPDQLAGLFGELHVLFELVKHSNDAVAAWTGPDGARFDFQSATDALEVKTSSARDDAAIEIHGVDQLQPPDAGRLYVAVVSVELLSSGVSVPESVHQIRTSAVDNLHFSSKLRSAGYNDGDARHYDNVRFHVRSVTGYLVNDDFPRIVRTSFAAGDLPAGVSRLRYSVRLGGVPAMPASELDEVLRLFRTL